MAENIVIKELSDNTISVRPLQDKLRTVPEDRPAPQNITQFDNIKNCKTERHTRHFCICPYERVEWLARQTALCTFLYCVTIMTGFSAWSHVSVKWAQEHSKLQTRVQHYLQIELSGKQQRVSLLLDAQSTDDVTRRNEWVKNNRLILCRFINVVFSSADQEFPFRGQDECFK
jgi:hypothetical protein